MDWEERYLSDEELGNLMVQVEQQELVMAPPDLKESILGRVKESRTPQPARRDKKSEFRQYCIRVWTSVAAAVVLVFLLPAVSSRMERPPKKENVLMQVFGGSNIFDSDDVFHFFDNNGGREYETETKE